MERPFRAYQGDEPYIFVCYAHDDDALVYPEITRLREAGFQIWYDEGISPGSEWSESIAQHIEQCITFLYFVTPRSVEREHCRREVNFAMEQPCAILPVHLEETQMPSAVKLNLSHRQAILKHDHSRAAYEEKLDQALVAATTGVVGSQGGGSPTVTHHSTRTGNPPSAWTLRRWSLPVVGVVFISLLVPAAWWLFGQESPDATSNATEASKAAASSDDLTHNRLAILPFRNLTGDPSLDWFVEGLTAQLYDQINSTGTIPVLPTALVTGDQTEDADLLLDGRVEVDGSNLRITVLLIDKTSETSVWSRAVSGPALNPRELQKQVSTHIGHYFGQTMGGFPPPANNEAYQAYLRWLPHRRYGDPDEEMRWLGRATQADPQWGPGLAEQAFSYYRYAAFFRNDSYVEKAETAISRAIEVEDPVGYWFLFDTTLEAYMRSNFVTGEERLRSVATAITQPYLQFMAVSGLWDDALRGLNTIVELNPDDTGSWEWLALIHTVSGRVELASDAAKRIARLYPTATYNWALWYVQAVMANKHTDEALEVEADLEATLAITAPGSLSEQWVKRTLYSIQFELAIQDEDFDTAHRLAGQIADLKLYALAGILYLRLDDPLGEHFLTLAQEKPEYTRLWWLYYQVSSTPEIRVHPAFRKLQDALGYTDEHRRWLCQRANTLPPELGINCDAVSLHTFH